MSQHKWNCVKMGGSEFCPEATGDGPCAGHTKTVTRIEAVKGFCGFATDADLLTIFAQAAREAGREQFGTEKYREAADIEDMVRREVLRRMKAVTP